MKKRRSSDDDKEYSLVYSTDVAVQKPNTASVGPMPEGITPSKIVIRIERAGRSGKTVTVIARLHPHEALLKSLTTFLKQSLGCGGTFLITDNEGLIELQGDRRSRLEPLLASFRPH